MEKKTIIITGASDGIGKAAAEQLVKMGHNVVIVGRSKAKTEKVANELGVLYHTVDYSSLKDVVRLADELKRYDRIDVLCNNAGGVQAERRDTEDGFEKTFQINVLGGFLLTKLLLDKLCESKATVIQTSSIATNLFGADFDINDILNEKNYSAFKAYGYAKLGDILFTRELDRRYKDKGINAVAFEPGVVRTNFASEGKGLVKFCYHSPLKYLFTISPKKSAMRMVRLATGVPDKDFVTGETYSKNKPMEIKFQDADGKIAERFWNECEKFTDKFVK